MNKTALITTSGSGMGAHSARALAAAGFTVGTLSFSGKGEALSRELGGIGATGSYQSSENLQRLLNNATQAWGRKEQFRSPVPMGRYDNSLNEIASVEAFLPSEGGACITEQNIRVDGSMTRSV